MLGLDIKYNYPHTFFLSAGLILLIFGFYPFYITNFNFDLIHYTKILIHSLSIIISLICLWKGFKLWGEKEEQEIERIKASKKIREQEIELKQLTIERIKYENRLRALKIEIKNLERSKKEKTEEVEQEIKAKKLEISKLSEEIAQKQEDIENKTKKIYELQKEEVSKISNTPPLWASSISGANISSGSISVTNWLNPYSRKCSNCGKDYEMNPNILDIDIGLCPSCKERRYYI